MIDIQQPSLSSSSAIFGFLSKQPDGERKRKKQLRVFPTIPPFDADFSFAVQKPIDMMGQETYVASTTTQYFVKLSKPTPAPVETLESARPMLTDRAQRILSGLLPLLDQAARKLRVQVRKVTVSGYIDPEQEHDQLVVTQWVRLPSTHALPYWDKMGMFIDNWIKELPPEFKPVAERIAISVEWDL